MVNHTVPYQLSNPGAYVVVTVKGSFAQPAFIADCSVPCSFLRLSATWDNESETTTNNFTPLGSADHMVAGVSYNRTLMLGMKIKLLFMSLDNRPLSVTNVRTYVP